MKRPVPRIERRAFETGDFSGCVVERFDRQRWIQSDEPFAQPGCQ